MNKKKIAAGLFFCALIACVWLLRLDQKVTLEQLQQYAQSMQAFADGHRAYAVAYYLLVFVAATMAAVPITVVMTIMSGFLFGVVQGTIYAILGATCGALVIFLSIRYVLRDWARKQYAPYLGYFETKLKERGSRYLLVAQLLPFTPTPIINVCAGLLPISLWTFFWTTVIGILPGTMAYTVAGFMMRSGSINLFGIPILLFLSSSNSSSVGLPM